jgi:hypothetical protein
MVLSDSGQRDSDRFLPGRHIGLVGFEPTACRRGDRSIAYRAHLYLARSCNIAHAVLLRNAWQSFHCELEPMAHHAS